jgi:hypothetical protein
VFGAIELRKKLSVGVVVALTTEVVKSGAKLLLAKLETEPAAPVLSIDQVPALQVNKSPVDMFMPSVRLSIRQVPVGAPGKSAM